MGDQLDALLLTSLGLSAETAKMVVGEISRLRLELDLSRGKIAHLLQENKVLHQEVNGLRLQVHGCRSEKVEVTT